MTTSQKYLSSFLSLIIALRRLLEGHCLYYLTLIVLLTLSVPTIYAQESTYKSLMESLDTESSPSDDLLISVLEETIVTKSLNARDSLPMILDKVNPFLKDSNKRMQFLYNVINSRVVAMQGNFDLVFAVYEDHEQDKSIGKTDDLMFLYTTMGACDARRGNLVEALRWYQKVLELCESKTDKSCLAMGYTSVATIHFALENYDKVKDYSIKSYNIADSTGNTLVKTRASTNTAVAFLELKEYEEAEKWFLKNLSIKDQDTLSIYTNYNNMGVLYEELKEYDKAISYLEKALNISKRWRNEQGQARAYINLARNHNRKGSNRKAEELYAIGIEKTKAFGTLNNLSDAYLSLSQFYESTENPTDALEYFKKYHDVNDSIASENQKKAVQQLEIKYETQQKENELLKLSKQKQEDELVIARQNRRVRQLSFGLGAIAIFGVLGFVLFRQRLQNKKQQELILAISETQSEERKRIAQDLHDSIGGSLALTKSKFEVAKKNLKTSSTEMDSALETLEQTTQQVRQISHNLMPGELVRFGLVAAINTLLENLNEEEINAQFHSNQGEERLEPLKEIQLYRIVQEALQNVLKHARANNLFIQLNKHQEHLTLMIEDDGKGIIQDSEEGMGLKNIKQRVQLLKGIFTIDSAPERGTILNIQIPV
ncbi:MAG: sensor histidine kinase [Bacteroidota bacterium]